MFQILPGKRKESVKFYRGGYVYHKDSLNPSIYRCAKRSSTTCTGKIRVDDDDETKIIEEVEHDYCVENHSLCPREILLQACAKLAKETRDEFITIFNKVSTE